MLSNSEWLEIIDDYSQLEIAYHTGRGIIEDRFKSEQNACAAVHSVMQRTRGVFNEIYSTTQEVVNALKQHGFETFLDWRDIEPGDTLFSKDLGGLVGPDHVYLAMAKPDKVKKECFIFDNYSTTPHMRNLESGQYTPFKFGMRLRMFEREPLTVANKLLVRTGFSLIYRAFNNLPLRVQQKLNAFRHDEYFETNLK